MRKGLKRLITGIILGITGVAVIPGLTVYKLITENETHSIAPFKVPGEHEFELTKVGKHTIWQYERTIFEGQSYQREDGLPDGWVFTLTNAAGEEIPLESDASATVTLGDSEIRRSFVSFVADSPGAYKLEVAGEGQDHILKVAPAFTFDSFTRIMGAVAASVLCILAGLGITIWGIVVLGKGKNTGHAPT